MNDRKFCCQGVLLVVLCLWTVPHRAFGLGQEHPQQRANDLEVNVDSRWTGTESGGYLPFRIQIRNRGERRHLTIRLNVQAPMNSNLRVTQALELGAAASAHVTLLVPIAFSPYGGYATLGFWENGSEIKDLQCPIAVSNYYGGVGSGRAACLLWAANDSSSLLLAQFSAALSIPAAAAPGTYAGYGGTTDTHQLLAPATLPTTWLAYSGLDLVGMKWSDFQTLENDQRRALLQWVETGGSLILSECGSPHSPALKELFSPAEKGMLESSRDGSFAFRPRILGTIIAIADDQLERNDVLWREILTQCFGYGKDWGARHGISARLPSGDFLNFMIPGVSRVPVIPLLLLITLFVILIGPCNYLWLKKRKKLHLLLVTVPLIATLTSGTLLTYSVLIHGLGTRARIRSVTALDQRSKSAVTTSRLSLFAGLSPARLRFSPTTAVYPIWPEAGPSPGDVDWTEAQDLASSWLRSRTRTQFLTTSPHDERGHLTIAPPQEERLSIDNNLPWDLEYLVVSDDQGECYAATDFAVGANRQLARLNEEQQAEIGKRFNRDPLEAPTLTNEISLFFTRGSYRHSSAPPFSFSTSYLERQFDAAKAAIKQPATLGPRRYVAILRSNPQVETGVPSVREEASLHLLLGRY